MLKSLYTIFFLAFVITHTVHGQEAFFDPAFGVGGKVVVPLGVTENGRFDAVVVQPDGKIIVAGIMVGKAVVARFKENGSPDSSFATNGFYTGSDYSHFYDITLQANGKILAEGNIDAGDECPMQTLAAEVYSLPTSAQGMITVTRSLYRQTVK